MTINKIYTQITWDLDIYISIYNQFLYQNNIGHKI